MKKITNEFEIANKSYKVQNHQIVPELNSYEFINQEIQKKGYCNYAEYLAEIENKKALDSVNEKEKLLKERKNKTKAYLKSYNVKNKEKEEQIKLEQERKKEMKKNQEEYNKQLKEKVISKNKINSSIIDGKANNSNTSNIDTVNCFSNDQEKKELKGKVYVVKHSNLPPNNNNDDNYLKVIDETLNENESNLKNIVSEAEKRKKEEFENPDFDYIINVKSQIEELVLDSLYENNQNSNVFKNNLKSSSDIAENAIMKNIKDTFNKSNKPVEQKIKTGIDSVKEFRKRGLITNADLEEEKPAVLNVSPQQVINNSSTGNVNSGNSISKQTMFRNQLEKRRYVKALKNLMIEKFSEKNIVIPNICSCGQLQKNLDTLLEKGNVSVLSIVNTECANNCIYYNNNKEYKKALSDIIGSVKNLKFDVFH